MEKQVEENHSAGLHMNQSEMNYAHPLAFDIYPTGPFLFSLKLKFFQTSLPHLFLRENEWAEFFSSNQCKIKLLYVLFLTLMDVPGWMR